MQGELGGNGAWLRVDRGGAEGVEVLGGAGVHLAVPCTCCSRCLMTLSTLTSTPSTFTAKGNSSASSLWYQPNFLSVPLLWTSSSSRCPASSPGLYWRSSLFRSHLILLASSPSSSTTLYLAARVSRVVAMLVEGHVEQEVGVTREDSRSPCRVSTAQTTLALASTSSFHLSWRCTGKGRGGRGMEGGGGAGGE